MWKLIENSFPEGIIVKTSINSGEKNIQNLKKSGNLWWHSDGSMYVYYTPTHYWSN